MLQETHSNSGHSSRNLTDVINPRFLAIEEDSPGSEKSQRDWHAAEFGKRGTGLANAETWHP